MTNYELKNIDPEDIGDLLVKVENSFDIKFMGDELVHIITFGQLCDLIADKIQLDDLNDCSSQQAFYKLRCAISAALEIDTKTITTNDSLASLLPRQGRRSKTKQIEKYLGFKLNILRPPHWVTGTLAILFLASVICLFMNWPIGLLGLISSILGFWLSDKFGNKLDLKTVGHMAEKMTRENYLKSRRNPTTVNKNEIEKVLTEWFICDLDLDKNKLKRETIVV